MSSTKTPTAAVIEKIVERRPVWAKAVAAVGAVDLLQMMVLSLVSPGAELRTLAVALDFSMVALAGMLLLWVWNGSRRARNGLSAFYVIGIALTVLPWLTSDAPPDWSLDMTVGVLFSLVTLVLLWQPAMTYWLTQAHERRKPLPLDSRKLLVRLNLGLGFAWVMTPLAILKVTKGGLSVPELLLVSGPCLLAGVGVLLTQATVAWRLSKASS